MVIYERETMAFVNLLTMIAVAKLSPIFRKRVHSPKSTQVDKKGTQLDTCGQKGAEMSCWLHLVFASFSSSMIIPRLNISPTNCGGHIVPAAKVWWALFNNRCGYSINSFDGLPTTFYNKHCYYLKCGHSATSSGWYFSEIESNSLFCCKTSAQIVKIMHQNNCEMHIAIFAVQTINHCIY